MDSSQMDVSNTQALQRKIRLKNLLDEGQKIETMITQQSSSVTLHAIRKIITASDDIINEGNVEDRAEHTTEVVMDAQVLKMNYELVSKVLQQTSNFKDRLYTNSIAAIVFKDDNVNWSALASIACGVGRTVHTKSTMLGVIESEVKERVIKERQQRRRTQLAQEKRPETIDNLKRQDKGAHKVNIIHEQLAQIFKANNRQPIPYYKLIIDPKNFMNTVENAFQMSFLARDGIIAIETGSDNYAQVRLARSDERTTERDTAQSICTLSLELCREMILFYDIKEPMLKVQTNAEEKEDIKEE